MLPLQQAYEVKQSIIEYLKATFGFKEKDVSKAFYDFIESPTDGIFKGYKIIEFRTNLKGINAGHIALIYKKKTMANRDWSMIIF